MANYYREFSQVIDDLTQEEHDWLDKQLNSDKPEIKLAEPDHWPGFQAAFEDGGKTLWFHVVENGDVEHVAELVHTFLKRFRPKEIFIMNWADWCSKPRVESFGGGAIVVSSKKIKYIDSMDLAYAAKRRMKRELEYGEA